METLQSAQLQTSLPRRGTLIRFNPSERWAVGGKTGTGKTVFEKWWLAHWYAAGWPIVIIDIKKKFTQRYADKPELATLDSPYSITESGRIIPGCAVMIYHPSVPGWKDQKLNTLLLEILALGNIAVSFDEIAGVANEHSWVLAYEMIMTQGRQSNIPTMNCFQKPVRIPTDLLEQSEWYAIFRVNNPEYRKKIVELTGFPELIERPALYYYWLANEQWDEPVLMAPVPMGVEQHGPKTLGASSGGLLDTAGQGGGQGRSPAQSATQSGGRSGVGKVSNHAAATHPHSRLHAHARG